MKDKDGIPVIVIPEPLAGELLVRQRRQEAKLLWIARKFRRLSKKMTDARFSQHEEGE